MSRFFTIYDGDKEHHFQESKLPLLIGSAESCQIPLPGGRDIEAQIDLHEGKYLYLKPETGNKKIFHNDQLIKDSAWIKSGDQTRIGDWVLLYRISGDRVEIIKSRSAAPSATNTFTQPEQKTATNEPPPLPAVTVSQAGQQGHFRRNIAAAFFFLILLLAALFVLTAHTLEIRIEPQPDNLSLQGKFPLIHAGDRYLGVTGTYTLQAAKAGYKDLQTEVAISSSQKSRYSFTLQQLPGLLNVDSRPEEVQVLLDGKNLGKTPLVDSKISGGTHALVCRKKHYKDFERKIKISPGSQQTMHCLMSPSWGRVFIVSVPAGAAVYEEDKQLGTTPQSIELDAGDHTLLVKEQGFAPATLKVQVESGKTLTPAVVTLLHQNFSLKVDSSPRGAVVQEAEKQLGKTPFQVKWQPGSKHELRFSRKGYKNLTQTITGPEQPGQQVKVNLHPILGSVKIEVNPASARIYIDGKKQKKTNGLFQLSMQSHKVEARAKGYVSEQQRVTPDANKTRKLFFSLDRKKSAPETIRPQTQIVPASETIPAKAPSFRYKDKTPMVSFSPARFTMGSSRREPGRQANEGQHEVLLSRPFLLGVHEVTNGEYHRFQPGHIAGNIGGQSLDTDNLPVVKVSWQDAVRYCNWLSRMEGLVPFYKKKGQSYVPVRPLTNGYRLPFEAEWEFAAGKVARTRPGSYPWDGRFPPKPHHGNYADESARTLLPVIINGYYDGFPVLAPVANFPRNMAGLFDMGGNVSEWCHDYYSPVIAPMSGKAVDPTGPKTGKYHVYRGSSWRDGARTELRITFRGYANTRKDSLGFRVARFQQ